MILKHNELLKTIAVILKHNELFIKDYCYDYKTQRTMH